MNIFIIEWREFHTSEEGPWSAKHTRIDKYAVFLPRRARHAFSEAMRVRQFADICKSDEPEEEKIRVRSQD